MSEEFPDFAMPADMRTGAVALHELYTSLTAAGFEERVAIAILVSMIVKEKNEQ